MTEKIRIYTLAMKYWLQGDDWAGALECDHILTVTQKIEPIFFVFKEKEEALNF